MSKELIERLRVFAGDPVLGSVADDAADRIEELERKLECERIRLAACGVVALANTPDSAARAREISPEYRSASLDDVIRAVDSEMVLRQERDALQADNARLREAIDDMLCRNPTEPTTVKIAEAIAATPAQSLAAITDPLNAHIERLRRILECNIANLETGMSRSIQKLQANANREELAATPEQSLARLKNQVREECAKEAEYYAHHSTIATIIAKDIRATKEPE